MGQDIAVSISRSDSFNGWDHKQFKTCYGPFENIPNFLCTRAWSPVVWTGGRREKGGFAQASLVTLDFDSGWDLGEAIAWCKARELRAFIATSKSHGLAKGSEGPRDRFRVVCAAETCTDLASFEHTMRAVIAETGADPSCADGARFYFRCKDLVWSQLEGRAFSWLPAPPREERPKIKPPPSGEKGIVPSWVRDWVNNGVPSGERHKTCFKIGGWLTALGYGEDEIVARIMRGALKAIGEDDVRHQVNYGRMKYLSEGWS